MVFAHITSLWIYNNNKSVEPSEILFMCQIKKKENRNYVFYNLFRLEEHTENEFILHVKCTYRNLLKSEFRKIKKRRRRTRIEIRVNRRKM